MKKNKPKIGRKKRLLGANLASPQDTRRGDPKITPTTHNLDNNIIEPTVETTKKSRWAAIDRALQSFKLSK